MASPFGHGITQLHDLQAKAAVLWLEAASFLFIILFLVATRAIHDE